MYLVSLKCISIGLTKSCASMLHVLTRYCKHTLIRIKSKISYLPLGRAAFWVLSITIFFPCHLHLVCLISSWPGLFPLTQRRLRVPKILLHEHLTPSQESPLPWLASEEARKRFGLLPGGGELHYYFPRLAMRLHLPTEGKKIADAKFTWNTVVFWVCYLQNGFLWAHGHMETSHI